MSDYFGSATLEDWLKEEVFSTQSLPKEVVDRFEKWREAVEANIEAWQVSDDGDGNPTSWRGWGRGFYAIPEVDEGEFDRLVKLSSEELKLIKN